MIDIAQTQVWRILHHDGLYQPWLHSLHETLFTHKAQFTRDDIRNKRNLFSWVQKPIWSSWMLFSTPVFSWCVVWALGTKAWLDHIFIAGCLTVPHYRNFLENELLPHLEDVPLAAWRWMWPQHDCASPHAVRGIMEFWNKYYERRIGKGGPVAWPAWSPNLNPFNFILISWG
jgi:hypothetical protein